MNIETVKMSSKGQIVIPQRLRKNLHAHSGSLFAITSNHDTLILRKLNIPSNEELIRDLSDFAKKAKKRLLAKGITEADLRRR